MEELVDAFLYLGPQDLRLREQTPADILLDEDYMKELHRRMALTNLPGTRISSAEFNRQIVESAEDPLLKMLKHLEITPADRELLVKNCFERKSK